MYLGLDQSPKRIGFAIGSPEMEAPVSGAFSLPSEGKRHGIMLHAAREWLDTMICGYLVQKICFESSFLGKNAASYALQNKLIGVIEEACEANSIKCVEIDVSSWRRRFLDGVKPPAGLGMAGRRAWWKDQAIQACGLRNWSVTTDDEAEACGILDYAIACDFPEYGSRLPLLAGAV